MRAERSFTIDDLDSAERERLRAELQAIRDERREQMMMLDVLERFKRGEYPPKKRRAARGVSEVHADE